MSTPFLVEAAEVEQRLKQQHSSSRSIEQLLCGMVGAVREMARPPISHFKVGAVALGCSGRVFAGVNLEFPGLPLSQSVHAEQFLIANMLQHGERSAAVLAVSAAPCGHCRQFLQELRNAPRIRLLILDGSSSNNNNSNSSNNSSRSNSSSSSDNSSSDNSSSDNSSSNRCTASDGKVLDELLDELLPHRFGPGDLLHDDFPLLLEPQEKQLAIPKLQNGFIQVSPSSLASSTQQQQEGPDEEVLLKLRDSAMEAANRSYAPYSSCPSGASILTRPRSLPLLPTEEAATTTLFVLFLWRRLVLPFSRPSLQRLCSAASRLVASCSFTTQLSHENCPEKASTHTLFGTMYSR